MRDRRRQILMLAGLLSLLGGLVAYRASQWIGGGEPPVPAAQPSRPGAVGVLGQLTAPEVRLDALAGAGEVAAASTGRNPFRFQPRAAQATPPRVAAPAPRVPPTPPPVGRPPVASPNSMPLRFIGIVGSESVGKIAVLTDGRFVYHGRSGEIIEGRYRIVQIGLESIEVELVDGQGRQTIRLTGS